MTIHVDSWQAAMVFLLTAGSLFMAVAGLHWKIVAAPLLKKMLSPFGERLDIVNRVVRTAYPVQYDEAQKQVIQDRQLRSAI